MKIKIHDPIGFSFIGKRAINQDYIYPKATLATDLESLFLVCDGIGGIEKGEEASRMVCAGFSAYYQANLPTDAIDENYLYQSFNYTQNTEFSIFEKQYPEINKIGTTLTLLQIHQQGISLAHIGDSRIYHIRSGQILHKTKDHKAIQDLIDSGTITEEIAKTHPWRSRITRAIMFPKQTEKSDKADIKHITDVVANDYFFLCTDGVLEQLEDKQLCEILSSTNTNETKMDNIKNICADKTKDNYSAYLIQIKEIEKEKFDFFEQIKKQFNLIF